MIPTRVGELMELTKKFENEIYKWQSASFATQAACLIVFQHYFSFSLFLFLNMRYHIS